MIHNVQCPHCTRKLGIDEKHLGRAVTCPLCQMTFTPPRPSLPEPEPPIAEAVQETPQPKRSQVAWRSSPTDQFADRFGIDIDEEHEVAVSGKTSAERQLEDWREAMPEIPSAYQPSGKMPTSGLLALMGGSVAGMLGGALTFLVAFALTAVLTGLLAALIGLMAATCGRVLCIAVIACVAVAVIGAGISYGALGWAAAAITAGIGMFGKNRNTTAAVLFSLGAALGALVLSHFSANWISGRLMEWIDPAEAAAPNAGMTWIDWVEFGVEGLGSILAFICAGFCGQGMVRDSKFCEDCEAYMSEQQQRQLHLGVTKALVVALKEGEIDVAADLLKSRKGNAGLPTLFWCDQCSKGYLEVQAKFKCTWTKDNDTEELEKEWLVASVALEPDEVDLFPKSSRDEDSD